MAQGAENTAAVDEVTVLKEVVDAQSKQLEDQANRVKELSDELRIMRNGLFGRRRESINPNQLRLFGDEAAPADEYVEVELPARKVKRKKKSRRSLRLDGSAIRADVAVRVIITVRISRMQLRLVMLNCRMILEVRSLHRKKSKRNLKHGVGLVGIRKRISQKL